MNILPGILVSLILLFILLGWTMPLIGGIVRLKRRKSRGLVRTIIGGIWCALAIALISVGVWGYVLARQYAGMAPEDFDPAQHEGPTGKIILSHKGPSSLILAEAKADKGPKFPCKLISCSATDGILVAPTGKFYPYYYKLSQEEKDGQTWSADGFLLPGAGEAIAIEPGSEQQLEIGPPFNAKINFAKKAKMK